MATATNVEATAVSTIDWLSAAATTIVVPVYQRQYRWDIGGCEQLLGDIRAVADSNDGHTHFIGSILSSEDIRENGRAPDSTSELVLIDGQQRITTLMLLVAALHHTVRETDPVMAAQLERVLVNGTTGHTKLRPHRAWAETFENVVLDRDRAAELRDSRFDDNYAFFRSQVHSDEATRIWRGLRKLEHVAITLGADANAQQIFESLNSTGEPLRDHELIHNYVLMGLSHAEQSEIEDDYWLPIEHSTGELIGTFWRHFLMMTTGREVAVAGEHGVYGAFRQEFPRLDVHTLRAHAAQWREFADIYRILLDPAQAPDAEIGRHLGYLNTFGRSMYPLIMRAYQEYTTGTLSKDALIATLEQIQSLLLRRTLVGLPTDRLVARLCRARATGGDQLVQAISRIMPSDERVSAALKYSELPHPAYVLGRIQQIDSTDLDIEHVVPLVPGESWSGDGIRVWADYSEDEQNSHRALASTLGNLTLLEPELAFRAIELPFPAKRDEIYARSRVEGAKDLADVPQWDTAALIARTVELTRRFLEIWQRPAFVEIDDDGLTPILDAHRRRGWPRGWEREFDYVEYRGEHWEIYDVKSLFNRVFRRGWVDTHDAVVAFSARRGGPIYDAQAWNGQWDALDEENFLYMGWDPKYMMTSIQGVLEESGLASEVFVKYSYRAANM